MSILCTSIPYYNAVSYYFNGYLRLWQNNIFTMKDKVAGRREKVKGGKLALDHALMWMDEEVPIAGNNHTN